MRFLPTRCAPSLISFRPLRLLTVIALFTTLALLVWGSAPAQEPAKPDSQSPPSGDYVGMDTCITCHADQGTHFQNTVMGRAFAHPRTDLEKLGCEACHGPGKAHVDAGGGKDTIAIRFTKDSKNTVEEKNNACLSCHAKGNR